MPGREKFRCRRLLLLEVQSRRDVCSDPDLLVGLGWKNTQFRKGRREGASGVLVRLVSLWWEFPPRLDSNNNILVRQKQQFFVFQNC